MARRIGTLGPEEPLAMAVVDAIRTGDAAALERLLDEHPGLAGARIGDDGPGGTSRTLLHVATDWPGHVPHVADTVAVLVRSGAEVDARFHGAHAETPLHWAASSNDVAAVDALLDAGADIDAPGAVIGGGTPLADARAFGQWQAARRLVERGAQTTLQDAATLGLTDRLEAALSADDPPSSEEIDAAFWGACHGGQPGAAAALLEHGADLDWLAPWDASTPLDAAVRQDAGPLVDWLRARGATSARGRG